jgi:hypothetical protein
MYSLLLFLCNCVVSWFGSRAIPKIENFEAWNECKLYLSIQVWSSWSHHISIEKSDLLMFHMEIITGYFTNYTNFMETSFLVQRTLSELLNNSIIIYGFVPFAMKNGVFWDVTPCGSCENRRFGGT